MKWRESRKTRGSKPRGTPALPPETAEVQPGTEEAEAQQALKQAPGYGYVAPDKLHGKIRASLKEKAEEMYNEAVENPNSEANLMVRILLLNQVAEMQAESYRRDPRLVLTEERHRGTEEQRKAEMDRQKTEQHGLRRTKQDAELRLLNLRIRDLTQTVLERERIISEARQAALAAKRAAENGKPMDAMAVYNRIAEIVGLRPPAGEAMTGNQPSGISGVGPGFARNSE